jgi:hypothetical protein
VYVVAVQGTQTRHFTRSELAPVLHYLFAAAQDYHKHEMAKGCFRNVRPISTPEFYAEEVHAN